MFRTIKSKTIAIDEWLTTCTLPSDHKSTQPCGVNQRTPVDSPMRWKTDVGFKALPFQHRSCVHGGEINGGNCRVMQAAVSSHVDQEHLFSNSDIDHSRLGSECLCPPPFHGVSMLTARTDNIFNWNTCRFLKRFINIDIK